MEPGPPPPAEPSPFPPPPAAVPKQQPTSHLCGVGLQRPLSPPRHMRPPVQPTKRAQNGNACQRCYDSKTKCCGQFPCERCFKLCLPCRPRPRINGKAPPPDSALARFLMTFRGRVQAQRLAAWRAFRAAHDMPLTEEPELLRFDHEGAVVNGAPLTLKEVAETGPEEQALLVELVVSRVDESLLREGFLRAVMAARAQGRLHRPATVATIRAWRRVNRLMGGDTTLGLAFAVAKALGLTPWELGEWHDSAAAEEGDGSGRARCLLSQPEEPGMTPEARRQCATALSQRAAQTAQRIKASPFFQTLAGAGAIPGCRGATPHRGAGVCILARADVAVGGESGVGEGEFHMVANEAWGRFFPPAAEGDFVGDAYAARCLPSILLAGFIHAADRPLWFNHLVDAFFSEPLPVSPPPSADGVLPPLPPPQPPFKAGFFKVFDRAGDARVVMARFARLSTTAVGFGLVPSGAPGHESPVACLVVRVEPVPISRHVTDRPDALVPRKTKHFRRGYGNFAAANGRLPPQQQATNAADVSGSAVLAPLWAEEEEHEGNGVRLAPMAVACLGVGGRLSRGDREGSPSSSSASSSPGSVKVDEEAGGATGAGEASEEGDRKEEGSQGASSALCDACFSFPPSASSPALPPSHHHHDRSSSLLQAKVSGAPSSFPQPRTEQGGEIPGLEIFTPSTNAGGSEYMKQILLTAAKEGSRAAIDLGTGGLLAEDTNNGRRYRVDAAHVVVESVRQQAAALAVASQAAQARKERRLASADGGGKGKKRERKAGAAHRPRMPRPKLEEKGEGEAVLGLGWVGKVREVQEQPPVPFIAPLPLSGPAPPLPFPPLPPPLSYHQQQHHQQQSQHPPALSALSVLRTLAAGMAQQQQHEQQPSQQQPVPTPQDAQQPPPSLYSRTTHPPLQPPPTTQLSFLLPPPPPPARPLPHQPFSSFAFPDGQAEALLLAAAASLSPAKRARLLGVPYQPLPGAVTSAATVAAMEARAGAGAGAGGGGEGGPAPSQARGEDRGTGTSPPPPEREGAAMALLSLAYWQ